MPRNTRFAALGSTAAMLALPASLALVAPGCASQSDKRAALDQPAVAHAPNTDPITLFLAGDEDGSIERLLPALEGEAPLLPPALRMTEPEFAARYAKLTQPERSEWQQTLLDEHQHLRSFTRALLARIEAAEAAGRTVEARHLHDLLTRFADALRSDSYTALTNTYARGIEQALARHEPSTP